VRIRLTGASTHWLRLPRWARGGVLGLAGAGVLCMAYAYLVEPYRLEVTHVRIAVSRMPAGGGPIRIVQVSDLHCDPKPRLEERLPAVVAAERPDVIAFTGDAVNSLEGLPVFRECMKRLAAIAPTFAVSGNWERWRWDSVDLYAGTGVRELKGTAVRMETPGGPLWVVGAAFAASQTGASALAGLPAYEPRVFLYHAPDRAEQIAGWGADLCLCGHTHGGQVALPFYGALVTMSTTGKRYEAGLYRVGRMWLYVNRGIGMEGGVPRVRFCARPEVTVLDLVPAAGGAPQSLRTTPTTGP
jgi:predicted MPP superfamily phosphohydrolase